MSRLNSAARSALRAEQLAEARRDLHDGTTARLKALSTLPAAMLLELARSCGGFTCQRGYHPRPSFPPRGIHPSKWTGPGWYYIEHRTTYRGEMRDVLQLCYVESDGTLSDFDEIDEVN